MQDTGSEEVKHSAVTLQTADQDHVLLIIGLVCYEITMKTTEKGDRLRKGK